MRPLVILAVRQKVFYHRKKKTEKKGKDTRNINLDADRLNGSSISTREKLCVFCCMHLREEVHGDINRGKPYKSKLQNKKGKRYTWTILTINYAMSHSWFHQKARQRCGLNALSLHNSQPPVARVVSNVPIT